MNKTANHTCWSEVETTNPGQQTSTFFTVMKTIGVIAIYFLADLPRGVAFLFAPASCGRFTTADTTMLKSKTTVPPRATTSFDGGALSAAAGDAGKEPEVTVFDAEGAVSWEEYKKGKPEEYQVN